MMKRLAVCLILCAFPLQAHAGIYSINSADVTGGKKAIESGMRWELDDETSKNHFREYAVELEYGVTDYWYSELEFAVERESGEGTRYAATQWDNTFQFMKQGKGAPFSAAFRVGYGKSQLDGDADEIASRFLFRYLFEQYEARLNIGGRREVGHYAENGVKGDVRASVRYHINERFAPALDYLGGTGDIHDMPRFADQSHRLGPVLYGTLNERIGFQVGYLAGISRATPDHNFKFSFDVKF